MRLSNKLLGQGYVKERLRSSLRKFYGRYGDFTKQYEVPLSRMLHDILDDDHIQWHPPLIGHYTNFWQLLICTLLPNLTFYLILQGFHRTYATGATQRTLTPPDTWSCPTLGLACVLMSRPISPELVLSPDLWISNIPRYFSFVKFHVQVHRWCFVHTQPRLWELPWPYGSCLTWDQRHDREQNFCFLPIFTLASSFSWHTIAIIHRRRLGERLLQKHILKTIDLFR